MGFYRVFVSEICVFSLMLQIFNSNWCSFPLGFFLWDLDETSYGKFKLPKLGMFTKLSLE